MQIEVDTSSPLIKCALKGVMRFQVEAGVSRRVRLPVLSWRMLMEGEDLALAWGPGGRVLRLCLSLSYLLIARSDEMFADSSGVVHPVHCLTRRDVAGSRQLNFMQ